jgi:serine/threonine-protein kinase
MLLLLVAVVLTVAVVAYLLATWITLPIRMLKSALAHVRNGNLSHRIKAERNDEFGLLFAEYNRMAEVLLREQEAQHRKLAEAAAQQAQETTQDDAPPEHPPAGIEERFASQAVEDDATRILQPKAKQTELPQA